MSYRGELKSKQRELKFEVFGFLVHRNRSKRGAIMAQNVVNGTKNRPQVRALWQDCIYQTITRQCQG